MNMDNVVDFVSLCRICLGKNDKMFPLNYFFYEALDAVKMNSEHRDKISIQEVIYNVFNNKEPVSTKYPQNICSSCLGILKLAYDLKVLFEESQQVIQHCLKEVDILKDPEVNCQKIENQLIVPVELIAGTKKYDLKDLVIVEQENSPEEINFSGFLKNLGTSISAFFTENRSDRKENCSPVIEILQNQKKSSTNKIQEMSNELESQAKSNDLSNFDQYIIVEGDEIDDTIIHITEDDTNGANTLFLNYKCHKCKQIYNSKSKYQNHMDMCGEMRKTLEDVDEDLFQAAVNLKFECHVCKRMYCSKTRYKKHMEVCGKQYKLIRDKHGDAAIVSKFQCELCSKSFKELKFLNYHRKAHKIPFFSCAICNQKFKTRSSRNYHRVTRHSELRYVCQYCGKKFATSATLNVHVQIHDRTKAQCICPVCGKTFHYKGGLFYHMKQHTNERKYKCDFCEKRFYTLTAKKRHDLTHTGVRDFECKYCQKSFFSKGELTKHEYIHTGVLPYTCQYCSKGFTSTFNMRVHWCNHPGSFVCDYCSRGFITREVLQFHCKMKHKDMLKGKEDAS